jgi:hypothetical protein
LVECKSIPQYTFIALLLLVDWPPDELNLSSEGGAFWMILTLFDERESR